MQSEPTQNSLQLDRLERSNSWLWGLSAFLLLALAGTVVTLYLPQVWGGLRVAPPAPETRAALAIGLSGLTVLFSLYAFLRQSELRRLRAGLIDSQVQEESLRGRLLELSSLFDAASQVQKEADLEPLLEAITRRVLTCLEADRSSLLLLDAATGELRTRADSASDGQGAPAAAVRLGEGLSGWVAQNNEPLVLNRDDLVRRFASEVKPGSRITAAMCLPLCVKGEVLGVLNVSRVEREHPFTAGDARLLTIFADHVAYSIRRIQEDARLQARISGLERARAELTQANRVKEFFLEAANVELRGPLTCILAYADFLTRDDGALDPQRRNTFARILREQAGRLEEIVAGSGLLLRLGAPDVRLHPLPAPLNQVMTESLGAAREAAVIRDVTLVSRLQPDLPAGLLDSPPLIQGVKGLLSRAIQLAEPGSSLSVATRCDGGFLQAEVNGARLAIAPQDLPRVFDLAEIEGGAADRGVQGLGLGLHLLRRVVELHGGRVWAEASPGRGSSFYFAIPVAGAQPDAEREAIAA